MKVYVIQLSGSQDHITRFADWLISKGHRVTLKSTGHHMVDGRCASFDDNANEIMKKLWEEFEASQSFCY